MPYRFALSREQRSTLPLVNSFLLRDCKNGHFLPRNVYSLDRCISFFFSSSSFFYFFLRKRKSRVSETRRSSIKVGEICVSAIYHPPLSVTFPFARRYLHVCVPASSIPRHPNFPRRSLANLGSLFFGDVREVHGALVNVFMGLWDN